MAPCNCGKKTPREFEVILADGRKLTVNSISQARAEITKAGGGRYVPKTK